MNKPNEIGCEVNTPDGRGSILSLHPRGVYIHLNVIKPNQVMIGRRKEEMHYFYSYEQVEIIKGQYQFTPPTPQSPSSLNH